MRNELDYAAYHFSGARRLRREIGAKIFAAALQIWETLAESEDNQAMDAQDWQKRSGGVRTKTVLALAKALADAQARFGENEFLSVERDGEKIRFRSKAIEDAFKARRKNREYVDKSRKNRKISESFPENSESFSELFEKASPRSEHLSGNRASCKPYLNKEKDKEEEEKKKMNSLSNLSLSGAGDSEGESKREEGRGRLNDYSEDELGSANKLWNAYPESKRIPLGDLLALLKREKLFDDVDVACANLPTIKRESWDGGKERFTPKLDKFLTDPEWTRRWKPRAQGRNSGESRVDVLRRLGFDVS